MSPLDQEAVKSLSASQDPYLRVLAELAQLHSDKSADYDRGGIKNADYFPLGEVSYFQMIWVKALRIRSLVSRPDPAKYESLRDSFKDLANYAIFALMRNDE